MGFLLRTLFVVGLIYMLSPLRADLPEWLINPTPESARDVTPVLAQTTADMVQSTCKTHAAACAHVAGVVAGAVADTITPPAASDNSPASADSSASVTPNASANPNAHATPNGNANAARAGTTAARPQVASNDPQAAFEALVRQAAAAPTQPVAASPVAQTGAPVPTPPVASAPANLPKLPAPSLQRGGALAQGGLPLQTIPLPPRRKI